MIQHKSRFACSIVVLIVSCDRYADLWQLQAAALAKFWPDCPYEKILITNSRNPEISGLKVLRLGEDRGWSANLIEALKQLECMYVLIWIDDIILLEPVDQRKLDSVLAEFDNRQGNCLRLIGPSGLVSTPRCAGSLFLEPSGGAYRVSTVVTVWRRSILLELLNPAETAWEFEISGSRRADAIGGFYSSRRRLVRIVNTVVRGLWSGYALRKIVKNVDPDYIPQRRSMAIGGEIVYQLRLMLSKCWRLVPVNFSRRLRDVVK